MAQKKVEWSPEAVLSLKEILDYYSEENGNTKYSQKLTDELNKLISYIKTHNLLGKATDGENTRVLIHYPYKIFYEIKKELIEIQLIWDSRRNPENLND